MGRRRASDPRPQARVAETLLSLRYRLPTLPFVARPSAAGRQTLVGDQESPRSASSARSTRTRPAASYSTDHGLSFDHPHFSAATTTAGRRVRRRLTVSLCGDPRSNRTLHRFALFGYDDEGRRALETARHLSRVLPTRARTVGASRRRIRDFAALIEMRRGHRGRPRCVVRFTARLAAQEGPHEGSQLAAVHARVIGAAGNAHGRRAGPVRTRRLRSSRWFSIAPVYDLDVEADTQLHRRRPRYAQLHLRLPRRGHPQHHGVRGRLPGHARDPARAELPLDEHDPARRERGDREQPRAQAEGALVGAGGGRADPRARGRGRARRGAVRRRRDRPPRRGGLQRLGDRGLLPDERAVARARGRARPAGDPVPGDRRAEVLRARRDQGRDRLPPGDRQPVRRRLADADREQAAPRDRRHDDRASPDVRGRARDLALGGDRVRRGSRRGGGAAEGRAGVPDADPVADGRRARADGARARPARARADAATRTRSRPSARSRPRAGSRTSRSSSASPRSTRRPPTSRASRASSRRSRSSPTRTRFAASRASSR